jgi:uncharacterized membrane protein YphA (DoxX/SURF4 family)
MANRTFGTFLGSKKVQLVCQLFLGGIFIIAGLGKLLHPADFADAIRTYQLIPGNLVELAAYIITFAELLFGVMLVLNIWARGAAIVLSMLLVVFTLAITSALIRGIEFDCGCFSYLMPAKQELPGYFLILRDIFFLVPGIIIIFFQRKGI